MVKEKRVILHTTIDPKVMNGIRELAVKNGTSKYGKYVEEALKDLLDKYGIEY
jgi:hypothetical protein